MAPELRADVVEVVEGPVAIWLATANREHVPVTTRGFCARLGADRRSLVVLVPEVQGARALANLAVNSRVAICFCRVTDYRAIQIKGELIATRVADEDELVRAERFLDEFTAVAVTVGLSGELIGKLAYKPAIALEVSIGEVFEQTPGPRAGGRL